MWGYKGALSPQNWLQIAMDAAGYNQSPVVIEQAKAEFDASLLTSPLKSTFADGSTKVLKNNGHSVQVVYDDEPPSFLTGGPLTGEYKLKQFHFHWGSKSEFGAEHMIDDKLYSAELHLVHYNSTKYESFEAAVKEADGLAVLTVFLQANSGNKDHPSLNLLTNLFEKVPHNGDGTPVPAEFKTASLLPDETTRYWTYHGSLTTPPCYESVQFIIYEKPIQVSEQQLEAFRSLNTCKRSGGEPCPTANHKDKDRCCRMVDNYRPTMPLNDRKIRASFDVNANKP